MELSKNVKLFNTKSIKLPNKKSMNLYQPDYKNDPKFIRTVATIVILAVVLVFGKFFIYDKIVELNQYFAATVELQNKYIELAQKTSTYNDLKEEYYRYSENYSKDEQQLVDRITIVNMLRDISTDLANISSISISGNSVSIRVTTEDMKQAAELRDKLESISYVKPGSVFVHSTSKGSKDTASVASQISFTCFVEEDKQ